jgi:hypothetical protein
MKRAGTRKVAGLIAGGRWIRQPRQRLGIIPI